MGQKLQTVGGRAALPVCACVSLVFRSLASVPLVFVPVALLGCVAAFAVPACVVPSISSRLTGTVPRTGKIIGQSTGILYLASQKFSERCRKKEVSIHNEIPAACWIEKRSFSSMLAPTLEQTGKGKRRISRLCHAPELQLHTGSFPLASRKLTTTIFPTL